MVHRRSCSTIRIPLLLTDLEIYLLSILSMIVFNFSHGVNYFLIEIEYYRRFCLGSMTATTVAGITLNPGGSYSQLNNPSAIFVDANNQMYILDTSNCRVLRWLIGEPMGYPIAGDQGCGSALTQITTSYAMHVDQAKHIYVSEFSNHRVTFWSANNRSFGALVIHPYYSDLFSDFLCLNRWLVGMVLEVHLND